MGIDPSIALTYAKLPLDIFNRSEHRLSVDEYFRLWNGIEAAASKQEVALLFAKYVSAESFDAPIFSALCCENLNSALQRLSYYKPLIGPLLLNVAIDDKKTELKLECNIASGTMPYSLCMSEAVFFVQLARLGTRDSIYPTSVTIPVKPKQQESYQSFFGCEVKQGNCLAITFKAVDANKPFLTASGAMWAFFEENLNRQLDNLTSEALMTERVKTVLIKSIPSGEVNIDFVASQLAVSKRTLQRKLTEEAETFQSILVSVRKALAIHYLKKSNMPLVEISYLLGFKEPNSFIRAFSGWNGVSPSNYREKYRH
nr:AraC family transcriptional regulator [Pseudoalteromonas sp. McH1-7]